ncbi:CheR family methyltransferase [Wenxinia marina]|uniref:protein-glutamate O-methyltransferase n=1 Tax=Wenxinia marina DSM 24838 TaxID=1123501 RepID=A0A0D0PBN7_9RHOB|nr:CheR family methyltransferase [Wenxinia marina]KIQ68866.1 Methylase of chemotaxis methyl-accepting protein [Wenxinia marina DSM 24838]GGL64591.1 hypothetical protein GCM10011392_19060 [Wenxinia marina]
MTEGSDSGTDIPVVAIGASAGGLDPLELFFSSAVAGRGWCYVVLQHLSPDYRSRMDELLARRSDLRIRRIEDGTDAAPDTIFLNPPNAEVTLQGRTFRVRTYDAGEAVPHLPIDAFFRSLASAPGERVAVVLSGSGADGSKGAEALQRSGGFVLVQSPREARFASMPRAVLSTGAVDRIEEAADLPGAIADLLESGDRTPAPVAGPVDPWRAILRLIERAHRIDFGAYKAPTVKRRIERRMHLRGIENIADYLDLLERDALALDELYHDMLIGVTAFYRDPDAIASLSRQALAPLVARTPEEDDIRIWVPACASGEEAYTIAIELSEVLRRAGIDRRFRIIATDVHRPSIERAAAGVYPFEAVKDVPEAIRERYFVEYRGGVQVDPALRQRLIFSVHNALADPPFMRLDLVSCRNLLIYLDDDAQARLLSMFLFGLKRDGFLFLGSSESLGALRDDFSVIDSSWRLFSKSSDRRVFDPGLLTSRMGGPAEPRPAAPPRNVAARPPLASLDGAGRSRSDRDSLLRGYDALLKRYAPSAILITEAGEVLTWFGAAGAYVDTVSGLAERTVEEIVNPALHYAINLGSERLRQNAGETFEREVTVGEGDEAHRLRVRIERLPGSAGAAQFLLVTLVRLDTEGAAESGGANEAPGRAETQGDEDVLMRRVVELERDLRLTDESLQYVTERLETSSEELQASNEELQASNEELQAANEELQASNEELQAVNEELVSVSAEHERKIELLSELNGDIELVFDVLGYGAVVLDADLRIRRYTRLASLLLGLEPHDTGRLVANAGARPSFCEPADLARDAISGNERRSARGKWAGRELVVEAIPARDGNGGAVLLFSGDAMPQQVR